MAKRQPKFVHGDRVEGKVNGDRKATGTVNFTEQCPEGFILWDTGFGPFTGKVHCIRPAQERLDKALAA